MRIFKRRALIPFLLLGLTACERRPEPSRDDEQLADPTPVRASIAIDREPNDQPFQASDLVDGGRGELGPRDIDYYRLPGERDLLRVAVAGSPPGGLRLDVVQRDSELPQSLLPNSVIHAAHLGGDYLLVVRPVGSESVSYTIEADPIELPEARLVLAEPNDFARPPASLDEIPARVVGFFDGPADQDVLQVPTSVLRARNATTIEISPVPGVRPAIGLYGPDLALLIEVAAQRAGQGVGIPNVGPPETLEYLLIEVHEADGAGSDQPYTLSFYPFVADAQLVELEPNDTEAFAGRLRGDNQVAGFFHKVEDIDNFRYIAEDSASLTITVQPDTETDIAMRWIPSDATSLMMDFRGMGEAESFCSRGIEAGEHFIEVTPTRSMASGLATYTLLTRLETGPVEAEPNDREPNPRVPGVDRTMRGYIDPENDVDTFTWRIIPAIDRAAQQRIEVQPPAGIDVAVEVVDDEGFQVAVADRNRQGDPERITLEALPPGTYRITVRGRGGARCDAPYTITIE